MNKNSPTVRPSATTTVIIPKNLSLEKCLEEPPLMRVMAHMGGIKPVADIIVIRLRETIESLGVKMEAHIIQRLCIDFIEKFNYETVPDLLMCLEAGRKGMSLGPKGEGKVYAALTMPILSYWMKCHLEQKYTLREKKHNTAKTVEFESRADYLKWAEEGMKQQEEMDVNGKKRKKQKHSKTLEALGKVSVSIGKGGKSKK